MQDLINYAKSRTSICRQAFSMGQLSPNRYGVLSDSEHDVGEIGIIHPPTPEELPDGGH